jgi:hypothetical protein
MQQFLFLLIATICWNIDHAQWVPSLKLSHNQSFAAISAPNDETIWSITNNFILYNSSDRGNTWNEIHPKGLANDISILHLYALNNAVAFLSVNTDFTGIGPGIIYRTTDGGHHWTKVFSHTGNCDIKMGMFDNRTGLLSCSFNSFDNSIKSGQQLYFTINGGKHWRLYPINPSSDYYIESFVVNGTQVAMADFEHVYFSGKRGLTWTHVKQTVLATNLQFEDSSYAVANSGSLIDIIVKRTGSGWISEGDVTGIGGALTGLVLDGKECWLSAAFDTKNNYYSADSAKTFTSFIADSTSGFVMMTKARTGRMLIGVTPFFSTATLWINNRINDTTNNTIIAASAPAKTINADKFGKQTMISKNATLH